MRIQIIQLEPFDDYASTRDRLSFVDAERVLLVWPPVTASAILQRKLDLILLLRYAARAQIRLAIVCKDPVVIQNAGSLNISVFATADAGSKARWKKPRLRMFPGREERPEEALDRYELMAAASRLRPETAASQRQRRLARVAAVVLLTVTALIVGLFLLPSASVRIFLARDQLTSTVRLIADPTIAIENLATGHIPATIVSNILVERQASLTVSGSIDVPATLASGTVIIVNQSPDPIRVPAGTVVSTFAARPARFRIQNDAIINGYATAELTITAAPDSAGPVGNVEANLINRMEGPLANLVAVRNTQPTRGGTIRQQGVVTKDDQVRLLELLRAQIKSSAVAEIPLTTTQFIAPGSIQIVEERPEWTTYSNFIGDQVDTLTLTLKVRVQALLIDEIMARKAAYATLASQLNSRQIVVSSVAYQRGTVDPVDGKGMAAFYMTASGDAVYTVNADSLRNRLIGVSVSEARTVLEREALLDPRRPVQISVSPTFLGRLPFLGVRIEVSVQ